MVMWYVVVVSRLGRRERKGGTRAKGIETQTGLVCRVVLEDSSFTPG